MARQKRRDRRGGGGRGVEGGVMQENSQAINFDASANSSSRISVLPLQLLIFLN